METAIDLATTGDMFRKLEKYHKDLSALLETFVEAPGQDTKPTAERDGLTKKLTEFLNDQPLLNFIREAFEQSMNKFGVYEEQVLQRKKLFQDFLDEADLLHTSFCLRQRHIDKAFLIARVQTFFGLSGSYQRALQFLKNYYPDPLESLHPVLCGELFPAEVLSPQPLVRTPIPWRSAS